MTKNNPLVSYLLLSYNQSQYISQAVESALSQDYPNIEYIISDDNSSDDTYSKIEVLCQDSKRSVKLNKNDVNKGLTQHFNECLERASGELIVVAAGDDIAFNDRVSRTVNYFRCHPEIVMLSFNDLAFDSASGTTNNLYSIKRDYIFGLDDYLSFKNSFSSGASRAFRRTIFLEFGDLDPECPTEDTPYLMRGLMTGKVLFSRFPGIYYRIHGENISSSTNLKKMDIQLIFKQHNRDLNIALEKDIVSEPKAQEIKAWLKEYSGIRSLSQVGFSIRRIIHSLRLFRESGLYRKYLLIRVFGYLKL